MEAGKAEDPIFIASHKKPEGRGAWKINENPHGDIEVIWLPRTTLSFFEQAQLAKEQATGTA